MKKELTMAGAVALAVAAAQLATGSVASAHNRGQIELPNGRCIVIGSEKSVRLPDGTLLDLRPWTTPQDEIGAAFAAFQGNSKVEIGDCT